MELAKRSFTGRKFKVAAAAAVSLVAAAMLAGAFAQPAHADVTHVSVGSVYDKQRYRR